MIGMLAASVSCAAFARVRRHRGVRGSHFVPQRLRGRALRPSSAAARLSARRVRPERRARTTLSGVAIRRQPQGGAWQRHLEQLRADHVAEREHRPRRLHAPMAAAIAQDGFVLRRHIGGRGVPWVTHASDAGLR